MKKQRSPRFPFVPLEKAVEKLTVIHKKGCIKAFNPAQAMEALGFSSMHGRAVKIFAALRAYDLISLDVNAKKDNKLFSITENGLKLVQAGGLAEADKAWLQHAALSPMMFRVIWRRAKNATREELQARLLERGFTEQGAKRATTVYLRNYSLAALGELETEPENLPDRGPRHKHNHDGHADCEARRGRPKRDHAPGGLNLPLSTGRASVPVGISEEEFDLLIRTLRLWKDRLVIK